MVPDALRHDLDRYAAALEHRFGADLVSVVLFGSRARGEARPESDLDVLVVARGLPRSPFDRYPPFRRVAREVSAAFASDLALIVRTPEEAERVKPYYLGMLSGHILLFDRDRFFATVLERLRRRLAELGSRRYVDEQGYEYWDLKPDWKPGDVVEL
jgi:predicted nucleotidyltransferase